MWLILPQGIQEIFATDSQSSLLVLVHNWHLFFQMYSLPPPKNKDGHNAKLETSYLLNTVSVLTGTGPPLKYFMYTSFLTEAKTNFQDSPWVSLSHTNPLSYILSTLTHPTLLHRWQQYSMNANLRSSCPLFYRGRSKWHVESCFGSFSFLVVWGFFW